MTTLQEARKAGNLTKFVREHSAGLKGDVATFNATLASMAGTSKPVPETSHEPHSDD